MTTRYFYGVHNQMPFQDPHKGIIKVSSDRYLLFLKLSYNEDSICSSSSKYKLKPSIDIIWKITSSSILSEILITCKSLHIKNFCSKENFRLLTTPIRLLFIAISFHSNIFFEFLHFILWEIDNLIYICIKSSKFKKVTFTSLEI